MNKEDFKLYTDSFSDNPQINKDTTFNNPQSNIDGGSNTNSIQKPVEIVNTNLEDKKFTNQSDGVVKYIVRRKEGKINHGSYIDNPLTGEFIDLNKVEEVITEDNSNSNVKRKRRKIINEIEKKTATIGEIFRKSN
uniref:Uncharacterized protein n=1 Tax=Dactylella sp. TaxID=1814903 RepID=A0A482DS13_9PEZI|nr:hypothetical protein [Dactylella sp.]